MNIHSSFTSNEFAMRQFCMEPGLIAVRQVIPQSHAERVLMAAILRRAAYDIALYKGDRRIEARKLWKNAMSWVYGEESKLVWFEDRFMSFENVCMVLGRRPNDIRHKISKLRKKDVRQYDMFDSHGRL